MALSIRKFKESVEMRRTSVSRLRSHQHFSTGLMVVALILVACAHIWQRVHVIHLAQQVGQLEAENRLLVDDTKKAQTDAASLAMASRIQRYAQDTLGMATISPDQFFAVSVMTPEIPQAKKRQGELAEVVTSIKRVADYMPVMSEAKAGPNELRPIRFDSVTMRGDVR